MPQNRIVSSRFKHFKNKVRALGVLLSIVGGTLAFHTPAQAVETVKLIYETNDVVVSLDEIETFAETGNPPPQLEQFLLDNGQPAEVIAELLTEQITLSENLREQLRSELDGGPVGQFVLAKLDMIIQGSGDLTAIKEALDRSVEDQKVSILELLENYTGEEQATVNLVGLRQTYTDVKAFVERIIPALETAKQYLQEIICDCETPQSTVPSDSSQNALGGDQTGAIATTSTSACLNRSTAVQTTSGVSAVQ